MYRSLYFKIILILIVFITTVMVVVGTILLTGVSGYFADDFIRQMESCFAPSSELVGHLEPVLGSSTAPEAVGSYLDAYAGALGLDSYRSWAVLSPDGDILNASETAAGSASRCSNHGVGEEWRQHDASPSEGGYE